MDIALNYIHQGFSAVFAFVLLLGLLIFVHELGHFAVAKWCGVRIEVFSLGFGRKILSRKVGDTVYCLSIVPLGGYVKMFGDEAANTVKEEDKTYSFTHKPVLQRIAIVVAGPLMNFFFAIIVFSLVAFLGEEVRAPLVGDLDSHSKAYLQGFRAGDEVVSADTLPIRSWDDFQDQLNLRHPMEVVLKRKGFESPQKLTVTPETKENPNLLSLESTIGDIEGLTYLSKAPVVGVRGQSVMDKAGLRTGDRILSINGVEARHFRDLEPLLLPFQNQTVALSIERSLDADGKKVESLQLKVALHSFSSLEVLGMEASELYLFKVIPGSPAEKAGLRVGDRITSVGSKTISAWEDVLKSVKSFSGGGNLTISVLRDGSETAISVTPEMTSQMNAQGGEEKRYTIGIVPWIQLSSPDLTTLPIHGFIDGVHRGIVRTRDMTIMTVVSFLRLIQNKISPRNIGGVISIGQAAHETLKIGIAPFLTMMAAISVHLFILNLLPIPVLDGGHLLFYCIEALKGTPLSMRKMEIAQQIGLFLLISLMVFALFNDVTRIFGSW